MATLIEHRFEMNPATFSEYLQYSSGVVNFMVNLQEISSRSAEQRPLVGDVDHGGGVITVYLIDCMPTRQLMAFLPACFHTERSIGEIDVRDYKHAVSVPHLLSLVR